MKLHNIFKSIVHKMAEWTKIFDQAEKVQIKSVTDALFRTGVLLFTIGGFTAVVGKSPPWVLIVIFCCGCLFLLVGLVMYIYFALNKPEYLRSETHQQKMRVIDLLGDKDNADNPNVIHLPAITNPNINVKPELGEGSIKSVEG